MLLLLYSARKFRIQNAKFVITALCLQVTLNAFVTANGCDGGSGSGDGGVIVSPTKSGKIITNRGNAYGHSKIKPGTVLGKLKFIIASLHNDCHCLLLYCFKYLQFITAVIIILSQCLVYRKAVASYTYERF